MPAKKKKAIAKPKKVVTKTACAVMAPKSLKPLAIKKPLNKGEILKNLAAASCITKQQATLVLEGLTDIIEAHIKKKGPGEFVLPGLAKFRVIHKPATKAREGTNPFTGKPTVFAAKPARNVIKIRPLKKLKDMAI